MRCSLPFYFLSKMLPLCIVTTASLFATPLTAAAGLILEAGCRFVYEDNINPSLSATDTTSMSAGSAAIAQPKSMVVATGPAGPGSRTGREGTASGMTPVSGTGTGDFYSVLFGSIGGTFEAGRYTGLFLRGDFSLYEFNKFDDLDSTNTAVNAGAYSRLGDVLSAQLTLTSKTINYEDNLRDGSSFVGMVDLKQQITPAVWLKEGYEHEKYNAESDIFTYTGRAVSLRSGYHISPNAAFLLGYAYLIRRYDDITGSKSKSHALSAGIAWGLARGVLTNIAYEHQIFDLDIPGVSDTDNIYSLSLSYQY